MASKVRILITTGDTDGIGWEVTAKALASVGSCPGVQFVFYRHLQSPNLRALDLLLKKKFKLQVVNSLLNAMAAPFAPKTLIEVRSSRSPAHWVEEATTACMHGSFQALVTAPLSKTSILDAGLKDIGHTEILSRLTGQNDLFMGFLGSQFSVVLATGHRPLARAITELSPSRLTRAIAAAEQLRLILPPRRAALPLALVGLNPHAGEQGLIGKDEIWFAKLVRDLSTSINIVGPLVPDSAFLPQNWKHHSVYICPYHDQGLIPFKMVHGFESGVHLTLGLPFVRTSVDHGTAKDLFEKNKAKHGSMKDALQVAIRLTKEWKR